MAERRDLDEIKLTAQDILDADIKNEDLRDLDLGDDLSEQDLLDDDFSDPVLKPRKRKGKSSIVTWVLILIILVAGGGFVALNKDMLVGQADVPVSPAPQAQSPEPVPAETPLPLPQATATVSTASGFSDLPQPDLGLGTSPPVAEAGTPTHAPVAEQGGAQQSPAPAAAPHDEGLPPPPTVETALQPEFVGPDGAKLPEPAPVTVPVQEPPAQAETKTPSVATQPTAETPVTAPPVAQEPPAPAKPETKPALEGPLPAVEDEDEETPPVVGGPNAPQQPEAFPPMPPGIAGVPKEEIEPADEYLESLTPAQDLAKALEPRLSIPFDQSDRNLGIGVTRPDAGANGGEGSPEPAIAAASRALDLERYQAAFDMFDNLYKTNKRDERILMGRAVALQKLGRNEEAIKAYDELLALNPASPEIMTNMLGLVRQEYPSAALQRLLELRQRYPNNAVVAAQTGLANAGVGNFDEGLRYLGIAAALEPENPKHPFNMAVIAERMGKPDMAITYYERALKADALITDSKLKVNRDLIYDRLSRLRQP